MRRPAPRLVLASAAAGLLPAPRPPRDRSGPALFFSPGNWRRPDDAAEPARPPRSPGATFLGWLSVALLVAALVLPFSLAACADLVRYLRG